ncbi:MAG: AraC family transcriptional regulator [Clostridiales bacterium]|nr:AraC family transcriptional regulator [Clostridiales bacterium]
MSSNAVQNLSESICQRIEKYDRLSELEQIFYNIHQQPSPGERQKMLDFYMNSITDETVQKMFQGITGMSGSIPEEAFFHDNENIFINIHPRYMPASEHSHEFFEIMFMMRGQIQQSINGLTVSLSPGDICFVSPFASHNPEIYDEDTLLVNILLRKKTLQSTFSSCLLEQDVIATFFTRILCGKTYQPFLLWHTRNDTNIWHLILNMLDCQDVPNAFTDRLLHTMVEQLFIYLLRDHGTDFSTGTFQKKDDQNILTIIKYAQSNYTTITLEELARHFNYNQAYLSRMLKNYLGCSFSRYFIDLRLKNAAKLLEETQLPVSDVLLRVGYSDKTHFYRSFQKKYEMTPQAYRKKFQQLSSD